MNLDFTPVFEKMSWLLEGCAMTLEVSFLSLVIGTVFGIFGAFCRLSGSRFLSFTAAAYVWIIRGTPTLVQVFMLYFALPQLGIRLSSMVAGVLALSFNAGAYITEIIRSSVQAIDKGQMEAALSIGMRPYQAMIRIIAPQAFKISLPPMVNEFTVIVKSSSLVSYVTIVELFRVAENIIYLTFRSFETYIVVAVLYLIMNSVFMVIADKLEKRLSETLS